MLLEHMMIQTGKNDSILFLCCSPFSVYSQIVQVEFMIVHSNNIKQRVPQTLIPLT